MGRVGGAALLVMAVPVALFLGYFDLHSDDTGVEVGLLAAFALVYGARWPRFAWLVGGLAGMVVVLAELFQRLFHLHVPNGAANPWWGSAFAILPGLIGAYTGAILHRALRNPDS